MKELSLVPELEQIRREIDALNAQVQGLCEGLSEDQLAWRPQPNKWSIAENLIHLETTTAVMLPAVDRSIADARKRNLDGEGPFHLGLLGRLYVWYSEPPPKIKLPAPKQLKPLLTAPAIQACPAFLASQQQMIARLRQANGLDLSRVRFQSPIAAYICMNLLALFSVFTAHERRHLAQISERRRQLDRL
jgi:hypothetical protein